MSTSLLYHAFGIREYKYVRTERVTAIVSGAKTFVQCFLIIKSITTINIVISTK